MTQSEKKILASRQQNLNDDAPVAWWQLLSKNLRQIDAGLLLAILLALFAIVPLLTHAGLPNTADGPVHLMRQAELNQAWKDGILYPRWSPDLAYGHGMPLFNYAPPLLYHVTQIVHLTGLALDNSMKGTLILMMVLYSVGMYLFARDLFGPRAGLLAAAVYLYAPYRLRETYIQGNYGQFCGLAFYPLILWSFYRLVATNRIRYPLLAAISLAGLLLSHNISTMIFVPLLVAYLIFLLISTTRAPQGSRPGWRKQGATPSSPTRGAVLVRCLAATGLGIGLAAFFWLPAFGERHMIRLSGITSGFFDYRHNFITLAELLALPRPLDLAAINPHYPLSLGVAQVAGAIPAMLGLVIYAILNVTNRTRSDAGEKSSLAIGHTLFFALAFAAYAFLTLPQSRFVWESVPMLELAEFPWRLLGPAILPAAVLAGAVVYLLERITSDSNLPIARDWILAIGLVLTIAVNLVYLFPVQFISWGTPTPVDVMAYEIQSGAIGTTSTGEFLPRWADRYPSPETLAPPQCTAGGRQTDCAFEQIPSRLDPALLPEGAVTSMLSHTACETLMTVHSPTAFIATFRALYWPGWQVFISEEPSAPAGHSGDWHLVNDVRVTQPDGLIQADLPAGEYQVKLQLSPTPIRRTATILAVVSLLALVGLGLTAIWHRGKLGRPIDASTVADRRRFPQRPAMAIGIVLVTSLLLTRPMADLFRIQSPPGTVSGARYTSQAVFGNQIRLLAFDLPTCPSWVPGRLCPRSAGDLSTTERLPQMRVKAGGSLPVVLYWQALAPLTANYRVFLHLDAPDGRTYASVDELNPANIPTSAWPPALYLRDPLVITLPPDLPPIRYTLTAGLYDHHTGTRLPVTSCDAALSSGIGGDASANSEADATEESIDALPLAHVWVLPAEPIKESDIPRRLDYCLGDDVFLLGYDLEPPASKPALSCPEEEQLILYWRAEAPLETSYTVFVHALDAKGAIIGEFDAPPLDGLYPTDAWLPGQLVVDVHDITLPPGTAYLAIGLYDPQSLTRLTVTDAGGNKLPDNAIHLRVANDQ